MKEKGNLSPWLRRQLGFDPIRVTSTIVILALMGLITANVAVCRYRAWLISRMGHARATRQPPSA